MGELPYKLPGKIKKEKEEKIKDKITDSADRVPAPAKAYSQEEVDNILKKREQVNSESGGGRDSGEDEGTEFGMNTKLLKSLQQTVGVFNALKEFASNPLTRSIESKIGERAALIVDQAFGAPSHSGEKKDLLDIVLNSQMAFGFGQGLGARGPELVESLGKTFGKERIDKFADSVLDQYGNRKGDSGSGSGSGGPEGPGTETKRDSSQKDLLLTLDPNNPEHLAAYADSQGGISLDLARKMLRAHQDDFIIQMEDQGLDVSGFRKLKNENAVKENDEMLRLKQEQEEMLLAKRELDKQLQQLDREKEKVVSFREIKSGKVTKEEIEEVPVEIPDRWSSDDLTEEEKASITKAENERQQAIMKNSTGAINKTTEEIKPVETVIDTPVAESVVAPVELNFQEPEKDVNNAISERSATIGQQRESCANGVSHELRASSESSLTAMCPKCRKIKVLYETEKGKMCETCKQKRGI